MELILEQLKTIEGYLEQIYRINPSNITITAYGINDYNGRYEQEFVIKYYGKMQIIWNKHYQFSIGAYKQMKHFYNNERGESLNILGNWDKWKMYEQLEKRCLELLTNEISKQKYKAETEVNRLKNITEEK